MGAPSRYPESGNPAFVVAGPFALRADGSEAFLNSAPLPLTHAQRLILLVLVRRAGRIARRWELYEEAFGRPLPSGSRAVDHHVARIRKALGDDGRCIVSIGSVGYRLDAMSVARALNSENSL